VSEENDQILNNFIVKINTATKTAVLALWERNSENLIHATCYTQHVWVCACVWVTLKRSLRPVGSFSENGWNQQEDTCVCVWWMGETKEVTGAQRSFRTTYAILRAIVDWLLCLMSFSSGTCAHPYALSTTRIINKTFSVSPPYGENSTVISLLVDFHNQILLKFSHSSSNTLYFYQRSEFFTTMKIKSCVIESKLHGVTSQKCNLILTSFDLLNARQLENQNFLRRQTTVPEGPRSVWEADRINSALEQVIRLYQWNNAYTTRRRVHEKLIVAPLVNKFITAHQPISCPYPKTAESVQSLLIKHIKYPQSVPRCFKWCLPFRCCRKFCINYSISHALYVSRQSPSPWVIPLLLRHGASWSYGWGRALAMLWRIVKSRGWVILQRLGRQEAKTSQPKVRKLVCHEMSQRISDLSVSLTRANAVTDDMMMVAMIVVAVVIMSGNALCLGLQIAWSRVWLLPRT
jgi:hypothetical protein